MKITYLIMAIAAVVLISACTNTPKNVTGNALQAKAPEFTATTSGGRQISLSSLTGDKPTVIYFMASWCPSCAQNWEELKVVYPEYKDRVNLISVSIDPTDTADVLTKLSQEKGFMFETVPGNVELVKLYNVNSQTTKFGIDKNGNIVETHVGVLSAAEWRQFFQKLL